MSVLKPILQAKWKFCSSQQGLLAQAQCHSNCSVTAPAPELTHVWLTVALCGRNLCLPGKDLAIELYTETNNSMSFCYYGCVSVVFPHPPYASNLSLFVVCPSIHSRVCPFFTPLCPLCLGFQRLVNSGPTTPLPLLSLHALFILNPFVSLDCELLRLCRCLPAHPSAGPC